MSQSSFKSIPPIHAELDEFYRCLGAADGAYDQLLSTPTPKSYREGVREGAEFMARARAAAKARREAGAYG